MLDANFGTVNNKTALDSNSLFWQKLLDRLNDVDPSSGMKKYQPRPGKQSLSEEEIRRKLASMLQASVQGGKATQNHSIWSGAGVKIDIHFETSRDVEVYEVKPTTAEPIDVYVLGWSCC